LVVVECKHVLTYLPIKLQAISPRAIDLKQEKKAVGANAIRPY